MNYSDFFVVLNAIPQRNKITTFTRATGVTRNTLNDLYVQVEKHDGPIVSHLFMHPERFMDIRKFCSDMFDPVPAKNLRETGLVGHIWTADVIVDEAMPVDELYAIAVDLEVDPVDLTNVSALIVKNSRLIAKAEMR